MITEEQLQFLEEYFEQTEGHPPLCIAFTMGPRLVEEIRRLKTELLNQDDIMHSQFKEIEEAKQAIAVLVEALDKYSYPPHYERIYEKDISATRTIYRSWVELDFGGLAREALSNPIVKRFMEEK